MTAEIQDNLLINKNPRNLNEVISEQTISSDFEIDKKLPLTKTLRLNDLSR